MTGEGGVGQQSNIGLTAYSTFTKLKGAVTGESSTIELTGTAKKGASERMLNVLDAMKKHIATDTVGMPSTKSSISAFIDKDDKGIVSSNFPGLKKEEPVHITGLPGDLRLTNNEFKGTRKEYLVFLLKTAHDLDKAEIKRDFLMTQITARLETFDTNAEGLGSSKATPQVVQPTTPKNLPYVPG